MKRIFVIILTLAVLVPMLFSVGSVASAENVAEKPFYALTWDSVDKTLFGNIDQAPTITVSLTGDVVTISGYKDPAAYAATMKTKMDARPEGMRYIRIFKTLNALKVADCVIYADNGVAQLKEQFTAFIEAYYAIGGKLDGIILDTEYTAMGSWYIYGDTYGGLYKPSDDVIAANGYNRNIYHDIVAHPQYATEVRPLLEERGFKFYEEIGGNKSEIWSMFPTQYLSAAEKIKYANCYSIWNKVMYNRISAYMNDAIFEPMAALYPDATLSDYTITDTATWLNHMSNDGVLGEGIGNSVKTGNVSNANMYNGAPSSSFFWNDSDSRYRNIESYNKAIYEDDSYHSLMFNVNKFKNIYGATDTKKINVWIAEYDYSGRSNSLKNSPYYTEFLYHIGLLDPQPFLVYMYKGSSKFKGEAGLVEYNKRMEVISQALDELTRVAGYSDRKPIETPAAWNNGFVLSGMYANGRNIWRLSPDTTDGMTLEEFKVAGEDPTFSINGTTIIFPEGSIISDSTIDVIGSCGYWIETPKDVMPEVTRVEDFYSKYPSLIETFEGFEEGFNINRPNTKPIQTWDSAVSILGDSGSVALKGTMFRTFTIPNAITASTNSYTRKNQAWEMKFTLTKELVAEAELQLLTCGADGGFKIVDNKVYYDSKGSYVEMEGVTLTPGSTYIVRRLVDFNTAGAFTCDYGIYEESGNLIQEVLDVPMLTVSLPVTQLGASGTNLKSASKTLTVNITKAAVSIPLYVETYNGGKTLAMIGDTILNNVKLPKNITAGDSYAKQQAWEVSFVLNAAMNSGASVNLLTCGTDGGIKLANAKVYYDNNGTYTQLSGVVLVPRQLYTLKREVDFTTDGSYKSTYSIYNASGKLLAQVADVPMATVTLPVDTIGFSSTGLTTKVYLDDYKLYPTGLAYELELYDAKVGIKQTDIREAKDKDVAYRLSWLNATDAEAKAQVRVARYNSSGTLLSDTILCTVDMKPNYDGVETGVVENTTGQVKVYLHVCEYANTQLQEKTDATCEQAGNTGNRVCKDCGEIFTPGTVIPAKGHKEETVPGKVATCTETGLTEGKKCSVCGETTVAQTEIAAKGHSFGKWTDGKQTCGACAAENTCDCEETTTETATKAATCTEDGSVTTIVTCKTCGKVTTTVKTIEALGHTEEIIPARAPVCTSNGRTEGKKCSVCGEILLAQEVIPATGHNYDDSGNCACGSSRPAISTAEDRFRVNMNGFTYAKGYIFYLESAEGVDTTSWSAVMAAAKQIPSSPFNTASGWMTYSKLENLNKSSLPEKAGTYVLFVSYTDAQQATKQVSAAITLESVIKPEITCGEDQFMVEMNGMVYTKSYIFYLENAEGIDTTSWSAVMAAAKQTPNSPFNTTSGWMTYSKLENLNKGVLPNVTGTYVLFVTYQDEDNETKQISKAIELEKKPRITCGEDSFTVDMAGMSYSKGYIFYLENAEGIDTTSWSAVMAAAKQTPNSPFNTASGWMTYSKLENLNKGVLPNVTGTYVLFVTYQDTDNETKQISKALNYERVIEPEITCDTNRFTVALNGLTYTRSYIFYLESAEGVNIANWSSVMSAAKAVTGSPYSITGDWMTYSSVSKLNSSILPNENGVYVLFVTYKGADGVTKQVSAAITLENVTKPEITCEENKFAVEMNGLTYSKGYVFYIESKDGVDTRNWSSVMNAAKKIGDSPYDTASGWMTYTKLVNLNKSVLPETSGVYVLFVTYVDANGAVQQISASVTK